MAAHDLAVEKQHGNVHSEAPQELCIGVYVEHINRWQRQRARKLRELMKHMIAELAVAALHDAQASEALRTRG